MAHMCEGSKARAYGYVAQKDMDEQGRIRCNVCDQFIRATLSHGGRRGDTYREEIYTLKFHDRHGVIQRYCPNPDCQAQLKIDLDKVDRVIRCPKCQLVFWFCCADSEKYGTSAADIARATATRHMIRDGRLNA